MFSCLNIYIRCIKRVIKPEISYSESIVQSWIDYTFDYILQKKYILSVFYTCFSPLVRNEASPTLFPLENPATVLEELWDPFKPQLFYAATCSLSVHFIAVCACLLPVLSAIRKQTLQMFYSGMLAGTRKAPTTLTTNGSDYKLPDKQTA